MLVAAVLSAAVMMGITYLYFAASWRDMNVSSDSVLRERLLYLAEGGVAEGIDHLNRGGLADVIDRQEDEHWPYWVRLADRGIGAHGQEVFEIQSIARSNAEVRTVNAAVENRFREGAFASALLVGEKCFLIGDCVVDGRDHDPFGVGVPTGGVHGMIASGTPYFIDDPSIGGNGIAPVMSPDPGDGVYVANVPFGDGIDLDGDAVTDEEILDAIDNDGDGLVDEDLQAYLANPDALFELPPDTIRRYCERLGTYFETVEDLENYLDGFGGDFPGGVVVYLATSWASPDFGSTLNVEPSIFIQRAPAGNGVLGNMSGRFRGLVVADSIEHLIGDVEIAGGVVTFGRAVLGSPLGLASVRIEYSSATLSDLPRIPYYAVRAWRDVPGAPEIIEPEETEEGEEGEEGGGEEVSPEEPPDVTFD